MQTLIYEANQKRSFINEMVHQLRAGALGIFPTDTVYGIGCDAFNTQALEMLYQCKKRSLDKPINILVSNREMVQKFTAQIHPIEQKLMDTFWPGPLTIIFSKSKIVPERLTAGLDTIGIRMPQHPLCLDLLHHYQAPLAVSSANLSNQSPDDDLDSLLKDFNHKVAFIVNAGKLEGGIPSTIVRVENDRIHIMREGSITMHEIQECIGGIKSC